MIYMIRMIAMIKYKIVSVRQLLTFVLTPIGIKPQRGVHMVAHMVLRPSGPSGASIW